MMLFINWSYQALMLDYTIEYIGGHQIYSCLFIGKIILKPK